MRLREIVDVADQIVGSGFSSIELRNKAAKKLQGKGKLGALSKTQKLYGIESRLKGASIETRKAERQRHAKPILDEMYEWMTTQQVIASSPLGKAIKYTLGQWPKLIRYIDDGHLSIDNNRAERAIKPLDIGRKN